MSEKPTGEKSELPTPKRLRDARERGQVARSTDIVTACSLGSVILMIVALMPTATRRMFDFTESCFKAIQLDPVNTVTGVVTQAGITMATLIFPIVFAGLIGAVLGNIIQMGFVFAPKSLKPELSKLNPFNGFKRMFSLKSLLELVKSAIKIGILGAILYYVIINSIDALAMIPFAGFDSIFKVVQPMLFHFIGLFLLAYGALSIFDFVLQKRLMLKELMMTKDETKREFKEMEGDPQVKGQRKKIARQMVMEDAATATRKSSVLVTNPTHFAVGIFFEKGRTKLPIIRVKGSGFVALRLMEVAREAGVPIVENVRLARALHASFKVNQPISTEYLAPVAEILRWVASLPQQQKV